MSLKRETIEVNERKSKKLGITFPAFKYEEVSGISFENSETFLRDALEASGNDLAVAAAYLEDGLNSAARKAASGNDEFLKMAAMLRKTPKYKGADVLKLADALRSGKIGQ